MNITQAAPLEMQEYLFSDTAAGVAHREASRNNNVFDVNKVRTHIRESMRFHRFTVISWLMQNGVKVPVELISDEAHPEVGKQTPDQPVA